MRDWKFIIGIIILSIIGIVAIHYLFPGVSAAGNSTNATPTTFVPLITTRVPTPSPTNPPIILNATQNETTPVSTGIPYYVKQGDTVYVGEHIDISGVAQGVLNLAFYNGYDCYGDTQYLLPMPKTKAGYYNFYVDPKIFSSKTGIWCKWNGYVESNGNLKMFTVSRSKPIQNTPLYNNTTLQNPNQTPVVLPKVPVLPVKHVADYLIARGDGFNLSVNGTTNVWIFGARQSLYDQHSFNGSVDITPESINTLTPGRYTVLIQTREPGTGDSTVRYDADSGNIQWFDPVTFTVQGFSVLDQTPDNVLAKLKEIFPATHDQYQLFNLEVQDPTITIDQIDSLNQLNDTGAPQAQGIILGSQSYIDVRGYTNAAPDTIIQVGVDIDFNQGGDPWKGTIATSAVGDPGGDMREWKALIPLKLYDMKPGRHFVSAKTALSDATISTADFFIYDNPAGNAIPNKTIRYISGRYGPEEMVPTPTPVIVTKIVTQVVTQVVTVPVTPSNEQVLAQQRIAQKEISDRDWNRTVTYIVIGVATIIAILIGAWMVSAWRRSKA